MSNDTPNTNRKEPDLNHLRSEIRSWGMELGFQKIGFAATQLEEDEAHLLRWLKKGFHGTMAYMQRHGTRRSRPQELIPGTLSVISARMDYLPGGTEPLKALADPEMAYVSRYALGRDYHKVLRKRLQKLATRIQNAASPLNYRVFVDSAPVLEKALARNAGLGWIGKHSNLMDREVGSWFFLGEVYTDMPLPPDEPVSEHCGSCTRCLEVCPTQAIVAPYQVDARRCISYLTIEHRGSIDINLRPLLGNRIYGCDDCQLFCPWNKYATPTSESDFLPRHGLDSATLIELFAWSETQFDERLRGSPIRRIGYSCWLRNIAVALGNAPTTEAVVAALKSRHEHECELVREHVLWALNQHQSARVTL